MSDEERYERAFPSSKKGNAMNSDDKLECLRLAIDTARLNENAASDAEILNTAKLYSAWVSEADKPNRLTFEKINPERK